MTMVYENQHYGILLIDSILSFIVLSVTLSTTTSTVPFIHVSISDVEDRGIPSQHRERNFCIEDINVADQNLKSFHCINQSQYISQAIQLWGLRSEDFNVSNKHNMIGRSDPIAVF